MPRFLLPFTLFTAGFGLMIPAAAGLFTANYSAFGQYISELGAMGMPQAALVNYGIFLPTGILNLVSVGWLIAALPRPYKMPVFLLFGLALGNFGAVVFPCDMGCPAVGSDRQAVHNLLGLLQYGTGGLALIWMSRRAAYPLGVGLGLLVFGCLVLMGGPGIEMRGLWQRVAELCLYGWLPFCAWRFTGITAGRSGVSLSREP